MSSRPTERPAERQARRPIAYSYRRFSSPAQAEGDSIRRQTKAAQEWCDRNGYELSTENYEDLGVSAFKGANAEVGALRAFLEAIEEGKVPQGSTLLVENLDRLSRQHWRRGLDVLESITEAGVHLVTLTDGKRFEAGKQMDFADAIMMIVSFERANNESVMKSQRVGKAWKANADAVKEGRRKRSTKTPGWIRNVGQRLEDLEFEVIEDKAQAVRTIFEAFARGEAYSAIARDLREAGSPTMSGKGTWTGMLVRHMVREVTPYGTLLIGKGASKDRVIVDTVFNYYPRIVSERTEEAVRMRLQGEPSEEENRLAAAALGRKTRGRLVGVLRSPFSDGPTKVKQNARSHSYYDGVLNKYIGSVVMIDQILLDGWVHVVNAHGVETTPEAEALEQLIAEAQDALEAAQSRYERRPSDTLEAVVWAAQAALEELQQEALAARKGSLLDAEVPLDLESLSIPDANQWVRRLVEWAVVEKEGRGQEAKVKLRLGLKNGLTVALGDPSIGLRARTDAKVSDG